MKSAEIRTGLVCLTFDKGVWVPVTVQGRHKTPGVSRPGPRLYDVQFDGGRVDQREAKQLRPATPAAPVEASVAPAPEITVADIFRYQLKAQQDRTLRAAEDLLSNVQSLIERLRAGQVPTSGLNINAVAFVLNDHARLVSLRDALEVATSK